LLGVTYKAYKGGNMKTRIEAYATYLDTTKIFKYEHAHVI